MREVSIPPGVPHALKIALATKVLGLQESTVRGWVDRRKLEVFSAGAKCTRFIPAYEVERMAHRLGLEPDWDVAIRAAEAAGSPLV